MSFVFLFFLRLDVVREEAEEVFETTELTTGGGCNDGRETNRGEEMRETTDSPACGAKGSQILADTRRDYQGY